MKNQTSLNKVIIVGMNPSRLQPNDGKGPTSKKLDKWMDQCGIQYFSFVNTFEEMGEPKLDKVDLNRLRQLVDGYDRVLALGGFASKALDKINVEHFRLPHPSPRNRLLNDKVYEEAVVASCRAYLLKNS